MKPRTDDFRHWLIVRLSRTKYARTSSHHVAATAARLGITPETLELARQHCVRQLRARSLRPPAGVKRATTAAVHPQLRLWFPKKLWNLWQDWCSVNGMTSAAALRSALHVYLQQNWSPRVLNRSWWYAGVAYPRPDMPENHPTEWIAEKTLITSGAKAALKRRALASNVTPSAILRGLVYECLDRRLMNLVPIDPRTMWDDPDKYFIPEGVD